MNQLQFLLLLLMLQLKLFDCSTSTQRAQRIPITKIATAAAALLIGGSSVSAVAVETKLGECSTETNPSTTTITCRKLGLVDQSLQSCQANENCVSCSSKSASKYGSPWLYDLNAGETFDTAWVKLQLSLGQEGLKILKANKDTGYILAAEKNVPRQAPGASLFYEFLFRNSDKLVLYRGVVDKTVFVYPLQQPVSDFNALSNRLNSVLKRTGWVKIGDIGGY